jgi:hypothetical protein
LAVEQEGHSVREDFAQQPTGKVPEVARPYPLYGITLGELTENGVDPVAKPTEEGAPFGIGVSFLGGVRSQEFYAHTPRQLHFGFGRVVVAVSDEKARGPSGDLRHHGKLMGIGRSHRQTGDETGPADPNVHPKAVEGLLEKNVLAESRLSPETLAPVGAGEKTRWQGHRVADGEGGVVRGEDKKLLPEVFLYLPKVSRLPSAKVVRWTSPSAGNHSR